MSLVEDRIEEKMGNLWAAVVRSGIEDLASCKRYFAANATEYFFLEPVAGDEKNIRTFTGLCVVTGINADTAAKAIFAKLTPRQQKRVLLLLKRACYEGIRADVIM